MKKKQWLVLVFIVFSSQVLSQAVDIDKTITVDNIVRKYLIHLPPNYNSLKSLPVIFALHGGGGTYRGTPAQYKLTEPADSNGFIIVYPDATEKTWKMPDVGGRKKVKNSDVDDVKFMSVLMDTVIANYKGDAKRIYFTGISRGGIFSLYLAYKLSARIKAIAPVCASIPKSLADKYSFEKPVSVMLINGTADPLISYTGGFGNYNTRNKDANNENADMTPTEELVAKIISLNNCKSEPQAINLPDSDPNDNCTETKYTYDCNGVIVIFIKVKNGGHTWPGGKQYLPKMIVGNLCRDFSAADEIIQFFMKN